jgi:thioredoxin-related protein
MRLTAAILALALSAAPALAGQMTLLMLEQPGCVYCARWNAEVGDAYAKTDEGRRAPLRRVDITEGWPADLDHVRRERLTPTFILLRDGEEVGRMVGYAGEDFWWPMLGELLGAHPE